MLVPAGTPAHIAARINRDVTDTIRQPLLRERFAAQGLDVHATTAAEFGAYLRAEVEKWSGVVRVAGLGPN